MRLATGIYHALKDHMSDAAVRDLLYLKAHGRVARRRPTTFTEKLNWRIARDRRDVMARFGDKLGMRSYAAATGALLDYPELLWTGEDVRDLVGLPLVGHWVLKPNHRSSGVVLFGDGPVTDPDRLVEATEGWLDVDPGLRSQREWIYGVARRTLLLERRVGGLDHPPSDFRLFAFAGDVALIQEDQVRDGVRSRRLYTPDWEPLEGRMGAFPLAQPSPEPKGLAVMLAAAQTLSADLDFVRVDLYDVGGRVYFSELSPFPGGGLARVTPSWLDDDLGRRWTLPPDQPTRAPRASGTGTSGRGARDRTS